jgi:hypothetical protein
MDDEAGGQIVAFRDFGVARFAAAQCPALFEQLRSCSPVDGAVNAAAAEQALVCGVYDSVDRLLRNVAFADGDLHGNRLEKSSSSKY